MTRLPQLTRSFKERAEALRTIADMEVREHTSKTLLRIANDYDRMADCAEAIERSHNALTLN
jgi:hypothetical protein